MIRIYMIIGLLFVSYYGFDGMRGDHNLLKISLEELETNGIGDSRYLEITDCYTNGSFVYEYNEDSPDSVKKVIFAVINREAFEAEGMRLLIFGDSIPVDSAERPTTRLLVQRSTSKFKADCGAGDGTCTSDLMDQITSGEELQGFTLRGTTRLGLDDLSEEDRSLIESLNFNIGDPVVFLEEDAEPQSTTTALAMLIGGIIGIGMVLLSFRWKSK